MSKAANQLSTKLSAPIKMTLSRNWRMHTGHGQVTYSSRNDRGQRLTYCLQDNGVHFGGIRLMRCSDDGEPDHEVKMNNRKAEFERPVGDSRLEILVREWIIKYEASASAGETVA